MNGCWLIIFRSPRPTLLWGESGPPPPVLGARVARLVDTTITSLVRSSRLSMGRRPTTTTPFGGARPPTHPPAGTGRKHRRPLDSWLAVVAAGTVDPDASYSPAAPRLRTNSYATRGAAPRAAQHARRFFYVVLIPL